MDWSWIPHIIWGVVYVILIQGARLARKERNAMLDDWTQLRRQHHELMYHFNNTVIELQHYRDTKPEEHTIMQFNLPEK